MFVVDFPPIYKETDYDIPVLEKDFLKFVKCPFESLTRMNVNMLVDGVLSIQIGIELTFFDVRLANQRRALFFDNLKAALPLQNIF